MTKTFGQTFLILVVVGMAHTIFSQNAPAYVASADSTCSWISTDLIAKAQGADFVTAKSSEHDDGRFRTATCYYKLRPEYQSVSLEVISHSKTGAGNPPELWREKFRGNVKAADPDSGAEAKGKEDGLSEKAGEAEHQKKPEHVEGVGDDAYWVDTGRDGALYVLQGERIIRLSLGGRTPQYNKKSRAIEIAGSMLKGKNSGD
jgi:hypothetical protein